MRLFETLNFGIIECGHTTVTQWWNYRQFNPFSKLYFIESGAARFQLDGGWIPLRPGRLYLVPSHRPIELACDGAMTHHWVHFSCELAAGLTLFDLLGHIPELTPPSAAEAKRLMSRITVLCGGRRNPAEADLLEAQGCLRILLAWFLRAAGGRNRLLQPEAIQPFQELLRHIHENLDRPLSGTELARRLHWHPHYFIGRFSRAVGITPRQYVLRKRMERARQLLWAGTDPVKAVAAAVGYDDPAHFTRRFRKETGMTPARYRKLSREAPGEKSR